MVTSPGTPDPGRRTTGATRIAVRLDAPQAARDIRDVLLLREGDLFVLSELDGNIPPGNRNGLGLYHRDTRFLSGLDLVVEGMTPTILLSTGRSQFLGAQVLTNPNLVAADGRRVDEQTLQIRRYRAVRPSEVHESLTFQNFNPFPVHVDVAIRLAADFADMFEVRGLVRPANRGQLHDALISAGELAFRYDGRDRLTRMTRLRFNPPPDTLHAAGGQYVLELPARGSRSIELRIELWSGATADAPDGLRPADGDSPRLGSYRHWLESEASVTTDNDLFNAILAQSSQDLRVLVGSERGKTFITAGIPWYATLFGRDSLLTTMLHVWRSPKLAEEALRLLADWQGTRDDPWRDEEPGKILHELRRGELARLGAIPFAPYYGSIDSTPLWIVLLGEHYRVAGNRGFLTEMRQHLDAAIVWMGRYGDIDGDGFLEYQCRSRAGLVNQGWKDSWDGIMHADGRLPEPPIALVEVQAYAYMAWRAAATILRALDDDAAAATCEERAVHLRTRFQEAFKHGETSFYALGLDGKKQPMGSVTSNPGHALYSDILPDDDAAAVSGRLMQEDLFSGWGIRTLSTHSPSYNPAGYHVGTVWPHENALIALGMKQHAQDDAVIQLVSAFYDAAQHFPSYRMPELFCGFARSAFGVPVRYPVACSPQAWAAASWSGFMQALLGLRPNGPDRELQVARPTLPPWLRWVEVKRVPVAGAEVDLRFERVRDHTAVDVTEIRGDVRVALVNRWT